MLMIEAELHSGQTVAVAVDKILFVRQSNHIQPLSCCKAGVELDVAEHYHNIRDRLQAVAELTMG